MPPIRTRWVATAPARHLSSQMLWLVGANVLSLLLGVLYWLVAARSANVEVVGDAALQIGTGTALASMSNLAVGSVLERFLPAAGSRRGQLIALVHIVSAGVSVVAALAFTWADPVGGLFESASERFLFVALVVTVAGFAVQDSELLGLGRSRAVAVKNVAHSLLKFGLLAGLVLAGPASSLQIVGSWWLATLVVALVVAVVVGRDLGYGLSGPDASADRATPAQVISAAVRRYWVFNFGWLLAASVPGLVIPVIVGRSAGLAEAAYFATAWTLVTASNATVQLVAGPFVSSASRAGAPVADLSAGFALTMLALGLVRGLGLATVGIVLMGFYGTDYQAAAAPLLVTMALVHVCAVPAYLYGALARVYRSVGWPMTVQALGSATVCVAAALLVPRWGLIGVGVAYAAQEALVLLLAVGPLRRTWRRARHSEPVPQGL